MLSCQELFKWLYYPYEISNVKELFHCGLEEGIPPEIMLYKIIEYYTIKHNNVDTIINKLLDDDIIKQIDAEYITHVVVEINKKQLNIVNDETLVIVDKLAKKYHGSSLLKKNEQFHRELPLPDPIKGRPYLEWKECYHEGCHKLFKNSSSLAQHLMEHNAYNANYHHGHEYVVSTNTLTPEKMMETNLKNCPYWACGKKFDTPTELCDHFARLGIYPFWKHGMIFPSNTTIVYTDPNAIDISLLKKIYFTEECSVCMDANPSVLFLPCHHATMCINCYNNYTKQSQCTQCILCKTKIDSIVPF